MAKALRLLGIRQLTLCVHDASFPGDDDEDVGRGSPYSRGGLRFVRFAADLGFTGLQLGPQGETPPDDPSPYRGAAFPKSVLSIALAPLVEDPAWGGVLTAGELEELVRKRPAGGRDRVAYAAARRAMSAALESVTARVEDAGGGAALGALREERRRFEVEHAGWLDAYAAREVAREAAGSADAAAGAARFRIGQFVVHRQHARLRSLAAETGLRLFADLPIGLAPDDEACHPGLFLARHRMGAPPSRTNPLGQPWSYPVLDPDRYRDGSQPGVALRFFRARLDRAFTDCDGLRIDHPHGLVDPWVYDASEPDPLHAVQNGARLFSSPALPDHPALARFAIARADQVRAGDSAPRWAEDWVTSLEHEQVRRYAILIDEVLDAARAHGRAETDVVCEVLSTLPYPVARVLGARGLGRFRVTQKRDPDDPGDPYRSDAAAPEDWIMVGTHDTPPLWRALEEWRRNGKTRARAAYLAARLVPDARERARIAEAWSRSPEDLALAELADLFAGPARQAMVFFADLLGETEIYNEPGAFLASNWTLRVPADWPALYRRRLAAGRALNLPAALALALRARAPALGGGASELAVRLDAAAEALRAGGLPEAPW